MPLLTGMHLNVDAAQTAPTAPADDEQRKRRLWDEVERARDDLDLRLRALRDLLRAQSGPLLGGDLRGGCPAMDYTNALDRASAGRRLFGVCIAMLEYDRMREVVARSGTSRMHVPLEEEGRRARTADREVRVLLRLLRGFRAGWAEKRWYARPESEWASEDIPIDFDLADDLPRIAVPVARRKEFVRALHDLIGDFLPQREPREQP
jgi:hypothetical protein